MRRVWWLREAAILCWAITAAGGLPGCIVPDDPTGSVKRDLSVATDGDPNALDMTMSDMRRPPGAIGTACSTTADCKFGTTPVCWQKNVQDQPGNIATPGGYCSSPCQADSDCAGQGICTSVGAGQRYCIASCIGANDCRHPDYACFILSSTTGYCWPAGRLACNPTFGNGECQGADPRAACIRRTFEDLGECRQVCDIGPNTCPFQQHCVYINSTRDTNGQPTRDKYNGPACFRLYTDAKQENQTCAYFDECQDGYQCNLSPGGDRKCHQLCLVGVQGACSDPAQKCKDVFAVGPGQAGLCLNP